MTMRMDGPMVSRSFTLSCFSLYFIVLCDYSGTITAYKMARAMKTELLCIVDEDFNGFKTE